MIWQTVKSYWVRIAGGLVSAGAVLGVLWAGSGFVFAADDRIEKWDANCIVAQVAKDQSDEALEWQRMQMEREKTEAREQRKYWRSILKMCMDGVIKSDAPQCNEARAALK